MSRPAAVLHNEARAQILFARAPDVLRVDGLARARKRSAALSLRQVNV